MATVNKKPRGRPKRSYEPIEIKIPASPYLAAYLDELVRREAFGKTRPQVAERACWDLINSAIRDGLIDRREAPDYEPEKE